MKIPSTLEPIYVVLNAYKSISTASALSSSVIIIQTWLIPHNDS